MIVAVIDRREFKGVCSYKLVAVNKKDGKVDYAVKIMEEKAVIKALNERKYTLINAKVENGKLKGTTGSLSRFDTTPKPFVIITEMVNVVGDTQTVIGYRVSDSKGVVAAISKNKLIEMCKKGRALQNAIFVSDSEDRAAHIRAFEEGQFIREVVVLPKSKKSEYSAPSNEDYEEKDRVAKEEMEKAPKKENPLAQFTPEQRAVLQEAHNDGLEIKYLWNTKYSVEQMKALVRVMRDGNNPSRFATPEYSARQMAWLGLGLKMKADITNELNPKYNEAQLNMIRTGTLRGVDTSKYANPSISATNMEKMLVQLSDSLLENFAGVYLTEKQWEELAEE